MAEHEVRIEFRYDLDDAWAQFFAWEKELEQIVNSSGQGEYDYHELEAGGGAGTLFMYGPDADALLKVALPFLQAAPFMKNAVAILRYGAADQQDVRKEATPLSALH